MSGIDVSRFVSTKSPVEAAPPLDDKGCRSSDAIGYYRVESFSVTILN